MSQERGVFINLEQRADRREHMHSLISQYPIFRNIERFNALLHPRGAIGCSLSHIHALRHLMNTFPNEPHYIILEDDFCISSPENWSRFCTDFEHIKLTDLWDVILLTPRRLDLVIGEANVVMGMNNFQRIHRSYTTTGYVMKRDFAHRYMQLLQNGVQSMLMHESEADYRREVPRSAADCVWMALMHSGNFYAYAQSFASQLPGFSDIENTHVDYRHLF